MRTFTLLAVAQAISFSSYSAPAEDSLAMVPEEDSMVETMLGKKTVAPKPEDKTLRIMMEAYDEKGCQGMKDQMAAK